MTVRMTFTPTSQIDCRRQTDDIPYRAVQQ